MSKTVVREWRCWFCDDVFTDETEAHQHFGDEGCVSDVPACIDPLRHDEKERVNQLRDAIAEATRLQRENERLEERLDFAEADIQSALKATGADSMWGVIDRFDNLKFELKMLREESTAPPAAPVTDTATSVVAARNPEEKSLARERGDAQ